MKKQNKKDIIKILNTSVSKIDKISFHTVLRRSHLHDEFDKFKTTKKTKGKMAFIITDNNK